MDVVMSNELRHRHVHFDGASGAAGDMVLAALLDLGVPEEIVRDALDGIGAGADRLVVEKGDAPILMEPVRANITFDRPGTPTVHILDHDGARTERTLPVKNGTISIDTGRDKTCYYLVRY